MRRCRTERKKDNSVYLVGFTSDGIEGVGEQIKKSDKHDATLRSSRAEREMRIIDFAGRRAKILPVQWIRDSIGWMIRAIDNRETECINWEALFVEGRDTEQGLLGHWIGGEMLFIREWMDV